MPNDTETETETPETKTAEQIAEEKAAAEARAEAAEAKASALEAEALRLKAEKESQGSRRHPRGGYSLSSFPEQEWAAAEEATGKTRKQILDDLNWKASTEDSVLTEVEKLQASARVREQLQDAFDSDPLSPKYKAEAKKFLSDIPSDVVAKDPEKWVKKAVDFAKKSVKMPTGPTRKPDTMDTKETGSVKDKGDDKGYSQEEKEVIESHGRKVDEYDKIKHPYIKDGIMIRTRDEAPRFGPR